MDKKTNAKLSSFYIDTMKMASLNKDKTPEAKNLYMLSFFGLLRNGCAYEVREDIIQDPEAELRTAKNRNSKQNTKAKDQNEVETPVIKKKVITIIIDRKGYSCDEDDLRKMFGTEYAAVLNTEKEAVFDDDDGGEIYLPPVDFGTDEEDASGKTEKKDARETESRENVQTVPYLVNDTRYPDDAPESKDYDTFLFDSHTTIVRFNNGEQHKCTINVFPLHMDMSDVLAADILVVATDEQGRIRAAMSDWAENGKKAVNIEYEFCTFVVRAEWKRETFSSTVAVFSTPYDEEARLSDKVAHVIPTKRTSSFYMRHHAMNGNYLNIFPLQLLRNDPQSGLAPAVVMLEDGDSRKIYSMDSNTWLSLWYDQSQKKVEVYWAGNSLHIHIEQDK